MRNLRRSARRGNAAVEFGLVVVPMTMLMFGTMELGRMAWVYQTLAASVKSAARESIVRGGSCVAVSSTCAQKTSDLIATVRNNGIGLDLDTLSLELRAGSSVKSCAPAAGCLNDVTSWPPEPNNSVGMPITIRGSYLIRPMFLQAVAPSSLGITLTASSREAIQF